MPEESVHFPLTSEDVGVPDTIKYRFRYPFLPDAASYDASLILIIARKMPTKRESIRMCGAGGLKGLWGREVRAAMENVESGREFPLSIFVYHASLKPGGKAYWNEVLRANTQELVISAAGLLHNAGTPSHPETKSVIKAVRYLV
jgi:hypothetical protein